MNTTLQTITSPHTGSSTFTSLTSSWRGLFRRVVLVLLAFLWSANTFADTEVDTWAALKTAMAAGGTIKLTANCTDTSPTSDSYLYVPYGTTVTLNLNGKTINRNLSSAIENGSVIMNYGTLTVSGGGTIKGGYSNNPGEGGGGIYNRGTLTINNATITGNQAYYGGGVLNDLYAGSLTIGGATISGNESRKGGGIFIYAGVLSLNSGSIEGNTAEEGGGIYIHLNSNGGFRMTGGSITNNTANSGGGIGIFTTNAENNGYDHEVIISGGSITNNTVSIGNGGGIYSSNDFSISGANGNVIINNNYHVRNNTNYNDNLFFSPYGTAKINIASNLNNSKIGILLASSTSAPLRVFTSGLNGKGDLSNFISDNSSYVLKLEGGEARLKGVISPSVSMSGWTYGSTANSPNVTGNTGEGTVSYTYKASGANSFSSTKPTNAGTHTVKATIAESEDYVAGEATSTYTVAQKSLTSGMVTITNSSKVYNGANQKPTVNVSDNSATITSNDYTITNNGGTDVGNYSVKVEGKGNYTGTINKTNCFSITQKNLTLTAKAQTVTYGTAIVTGKGQVTISNSTPLASGDALTDITLAPSTSNYTTSGTITPSNATIKNGSTVKTSNYNITYSTGNLTINKKGLTDGMVAISDNSKVYNGANQKPTVTITDNDATITASDYTITNNGGTNVGNYSVKVEGKGNYTGTINKTNCFSITQKAITITPKNEQTKIYGSNDPVLTYTATTLASGDSWTGTLGRTAGENVGNYSINQGNLSPTNSSNYSITFNNNKTFSITKATLTVTADNKSKTYGDANPTFTVTISGFKNNETKSVLTSQPTATCSATSSSAKGSYDITASGGAATNYSFSYTKGTLTVGAKTLTDGMVAISDNSKVYSGVNQKPTVTITDNAATITASDYTITNNGGTNVGNYSVSVVAKGNYTGTVTKTNCFTITPYDISNAGLTITPIGNQTYTGSAITPTTTVTATNINKVVTADYGYSANTNVGTVNVTLTGTGNYTGTKTNATTFQIVPKALDATMIADIADQPFTGSAVEPDLMVTYNTMSLNKGTHYTIAYANNTAKGSNTASATITASDANYSGSATKYFSIVTGNLNMATVSGSSKTVDYDGTTSPAIDPLTVNFPAADYKIEYRKTYQTGADVATIPANAIGEYTVVLKPTDTGNLSGEKVTDYTVNVQLPINLKQCEWVTYFDERFDLATPTGYQAYKVANASTSSVTAEAIDYIPKNVPVILKTTATGISNSSMTVRFNEAQATPAVTGDAAFVGVPSTSEGVTPGGTSFILVSNKFVLYEGTDVIPAHRCYLTFGGAGTRSIGIDFGDGTTGISDPPNNPALEEAGQWYDLQGRRIEKPTKKGMYIKDGKKVVITGKEGRL